MTEIFRVLFYKVLWILSVHLHIHISNVYSVLYKVSLGVHTSVPYNLMLNKWRRSVRNRSVKIFLIVSKKILVRSILHRISRGTSQSSFIWHLRPWHDTAFSIILFSMLRLCRKQFHFFTQLQALDVTGFDITLKFFSCFRLAASRTVQYRRHALYC